MTWYALLEISPTATRTEIKKAYRRMVLKHHPDAGGTNETMRRILEAYQVLSNPRLRREYDATLNLDDMTANSEVPDPSDESIIPRSILFSRIPFLDTYQSVMGVSNGSWAAFERCTVGIHSLVYCASYQTIALLAVVKNTMNQLQPIMAHGCVLIDEYGVQSPGTEWPDSNLRLPENWPTSVEIRPNATTRFGLFFPWEHDGHPDHWNMRWSYFAPGKTSGHVLGYIDATVNLSELVRWEK